MKTSLFDSIKNGNSGYPLTDAYNTNHRFYSDFIEMMDYFKAKLSKSQYSDIEKKILSGSSQDEQSYLQCMCELSVIYYVMRKCCLSDSFKYEPKYNGGYNPECASDYNGKTINIEVKCPNMCKRMGIESHDTLKLSFAERIPDEFNYKSIINNLTQVLMPSLQNSQYSGIEAVPRLDNKLKDYLEHSQKKFPFGDNYFNILVITLETTQDLDEWYGYLLGDNGAFTSNSYIKSNYERVDAVLLCTPVCGFKRWKQYTDINIWKLEETINLLILNPREECTIDKTGLSEKGKFYFKNALKMFGPLTEAFLCFQQHLDAKQTPVISQLHPEDKYFSFKENDICICSLFIEYLKNNSNKSTEL